jgi:N4-(beta-N-acetylglucosaminyl)-L-asparaginase
VNGKLNNMTVKILGVLLSILAINCGMAQTTKPVVVSTWKFGMAANEAAWEVLSKGGRALDAVETGVRVVEADADNSTVGIGGTPDEEGFVTLDACIMDETGDCGSVAFLQNIVHPISVARKVMEETRHIMLVGEGAEQFAYKMGFEKTPLLTEKSKERWETTPGPRPKSTSRTTTPLAWLHLMRMETCPGPARPAVSVTSCMDA